MRAFKCDICGDSSEEMSVANYYQFPVPSKVVDGKGVATPADTGMVETCVTCAKERCPEIIDKLLAKYEV